MKRYSDPDCYAVIGIGYFGASVARTLSEAGKKVIALDNDRNQLMKIADVVSSVYQTSQLSQDELEEAGVANAGTAVIAIGENLEASILATLHCIELGVEKVISKAGSHEHGKILEKIGAEVIFPEDEAGSRLATSLMSRSNLDSLPLSEDFSIISLDLNPKFAGETVVALDWRRRYGINVVAIIRDGKATAMIAPDTVFLEGDRVVLSGNNESLDKFQSVNAKGMA